MAKLSRSLEETRERGMINEGVDGWREKHIQTQTERNERGSKRSYMNGYGNRTIDKDT